MNDERRAPVQASAWVPARLRTGKPGEVDGTISWDEHLTVHAAYVARYGNIQSADTVAERHGFGYAEIVNLLGREPTTWRAT